MLKLGESTWSQFNPLEISFQVASMQFINIVVHSVEDMNFRVHLQYEFTKLGLDEYLDVSITIFWGAIFKNGFISCSLRFTS